MTVKKGTNFDVIIIGGGMVGAACALGLADIGLSIAVVEGQKPKLRWPKDSFDQRVSSLTRASQNILTAVHVWDAIDHMGCLAFTDMHVWDSVGSAEIHFDSATIGEPYLGHIVENRVIQKALWQQLLEQSHIEVVSPATPETLEIDNHATVSLQGGRKIQAQLVVAADGSRSWVREQQSIETNEGDYQQTAVVATVKTEKNHANTAWQVFLPTGPLAFLPLCKGYSSIVWSTTSEQADELLNMELDLFAAKLASAFSTKLGNISDISDRGAFPLRFMHAKQYVKARVALVGDAAHTIHPLAGQGVNLGFADAASLVEVVQRAMQRQSDIGLQSSLRPYERWRKGENALMLNSMSGFKRLFGSRNRLLRQIRNIGLKLTDESTPVKNQIMRHAMGLSGDLPMMAKPILTGK